MKKQITADRWRLAVYWLCAALCISVTALAGCGYQMHHSRRTKEERNALLFASDLLSLRDSLQANDGDEAVYRALLESRASSLWPETDAREVLLLLHTDQLYPLAAAAEQSMAEGSFQASVLRRLVQEHSVQNSFTSASAAQETIPLLSFGETDAAASAREYLHLRYLHNAWCLAGKTAFCRNAYVRFDDRGRYLQAYTVFCTPGAPSKTEQECLDHAVRFARDKASMNVRQILDSWTEGGRLYFLLQSERETACVGVRQDSAGVCFFLRIPKKSGNVLQ